MRITRTLFALALTALAALAFTATANAQVSVVDETTDEPCGAVTLVNHGVSGGCDIHILSEQETQIVAGTAGGPVVISSCEDEFDAHIDGSGEGYIDVVDIRAHVGTPCTRTQCEEPADAPSNPHVEIPWRIHVRENPDVAVVSFCLRAISASEGGGTPCTVNIPFTVDATGHHAEFNAEGAGAGCTNLPPGAVTVVGHWHAEEDGASQDVRIVH